MDHKLWQPFRCNILFKFSRFKRFKYSFFCSYIWKQLNGTLCWTYACWVKVCVQRKHTCNIKLMLRSFIGNYSKQICFFTYVCKEWHCIKLTNTADGMRREQFPLEQSPICYENFSTQISRRWTFTASDLSCISRLMIKYGFRCNFLK